MKNIPNNDFKFIKSVNHQDKLFVFALKKEDNKTYADIYYSVQDKQKEAEEAAADKGDGTKGTHITSVDDNWRPFEPLSFPTWVRPIGSRLGAYQVEGLHGESNLANTTEVYTQEIEFSVVSDGETITLFRKVSGNQAEGLAAPNTQLRIFADRFFYNLEFGKLINVNEVRYVRSNSPDVPNSVLDSFGVSSPEGDTFLEPTSELVLDVSNDHDVAVVQLPATGQSYQSVWHFLTNSPMQTEGKAYIKVFSVPKTTSVLFDTTYLPVSPQNYIPLVTSFVIQDATKKDVTKISNLTASLYCQNEEFVNDDGLAISMKRGGNLMIAFSANFPQYSETQIAACIDLEVGVDGYFAGASADTLGTERSLNCAPFLYYGTAVELDGQEDYLMTSLPDFSKNGDTESVIVGGWFKPTPSNKNTQLCGLLRVSDGATSIFLNIDQQGKLYLSSDYDNMKAIVNKDIPQMSTNQWSFITMEILHYTNGVFYINMSVNGEVNMYLPLDIKSLNFKCLTFTLGKKVSNSQLNGFAGQIAAAGFSNSSRLQFPDLNYFSEGCRDIAGTKFVIYGAEWRPSTTPAQQGLNFQFFDEKLLAVRTAILGVGSTASPQLLWPVQTKGTMSLLDAKDGLLKLFYPRSSDGKVGVCHFDPSVSRAQKLLYWKTDNAPDLLMPNLVLTALSPGPEMNGFTFTISKASEKYTIVISQTLDYLQDTRLTIREEWTNIPSEIKEELLTVHQLATIINGAADEIYDYTYFNKTITCSDISANVPRPLVEILQDYKGSILVQANVLNKNNEDALEALPDSLSNIQTANYYGVGSSWVLDPLLPILKFVSTNSAIEVSKNYQQIIPGSFTIESWFRYLNDEDNESFMALPSNAFSTNSQVSILDSKALRMDLLSNENGGQALSYQTADGVIKDDKTWQHLAVSYETGHALQFDNQTYVEVAHDASFNTKEAFTVETWYYKSINTLTEHILLSKWGEKEEEQSWALRKIGYDIYFDIRDNSLEFGASSYHKSMEPNSWNHIAASYMPAQTHSLLCFKQNSYEAWIGINDFMKTLPSIMTVEFKLAVTDTEESIIAALGVSFNNSLNDQNSMLTFGVSPDGSLNVKFLDKAFPLAFSCKIVKKQLTHLSFVIEINEAETDVTLTIYIDGLYYGNSKIMTKDIPIWVNFKNSRATDKVGYKWVLGKQFVPGTTNHITGRFSGYLGEFRVWNIGRTNQQIIDYTNAAVQPHDDGLLGLFLMSSSPLGATSPEGLSLKGGERPYITNQVTKLNYYASSADHVFWDTLFSAARVRIKINDKIEDFVPSISGSINQSKTPVCFGKLAENDAQLLGKLDNVRLWRQERTEAQLNYYQNHNLEKSIKEERNVGAYVNLIAAWGFDEGKGSIVRDSAGKHDGKIKGVVIKNDETANKIWSPSTLNAELKVYINGVYSPPVELNNPTNPSLTSCCNFTILSLKQDMGELRLWSAARTQEAIKKGMNRRLVGNENNLAGYWPMTDGVNNIIDKSQYKANGTVKSASWYFLGDTQYSPIPVSKDPMLCVNATNGMEFPESDAVEVEGGVTATEFNGFKELFLGFVNAKAAEKELALSIDEHPEEPVWVYIGQTQFDPKIVGFIEGAPPVPSENLSVDTSTTPDKYGNTAKVILTSEGEAQATHSINLNLSGNLDIEAGLEAAAEAEESASIGIIIAEVESKVLDMEANLGSSFKGEAEGSYGFSGEKSSKNSRTVHYELGLWGSWENNIYNIANVPADKLYIQAPRLYRPNNMGVAVVKSRTADLYALQDPKTGRTISYQFKVDTNIPEDVNYILFKINPAYLKNGSLDGRIGYDTDVDYPGLENNPQAKASFFKAQEAYQLATMIERQQKEWQNSLSQILGKNANVEGRASGISLVNNYVWTADGGLMSDSKQLSVAHEEKHEVGGNLSGSIGSEFSIKTLAGVGVIGGGHLKIDIAFGAGLGISYTNTKSTAASLNLAVEVSGEGFISMQADMSKQAAIPITASSESQYNANLETLNEGYSKNLSSNNPNFYTALQNAGIIPKEGATKFLLKRLSLYEWEWQSASQTYLVTTDNNSKTINFTPNNTARPNEYPIRYQSSNCPGKVTGYRFKTFYLKADKDNFNVLKNGYESDVPLIDPIWLENEGNPDAVAMRKALEKSNSIWRIFHRVTYVSRVPPNNDIAAQSFGLPPEPANEVQPTWIDAAAQELKKPDEISIANNYWLIQQVLGKTGDSHYINIDTASFSEADLKKNIHRWIDTHTETHSLSEVEQQRLYYLMLNYFRAYLLDEKQS